MQKQETLNYEARFADALVQFTPFAIKSMGLVQGQTSLKLDAYTLACVPYQFSMRRAVLAASLSKDEIVFFQRFKGSLVGLAIAFQRADARAPIKVFCRCQLSAVGLMKDREGVGLVVLDWKPIPPDLAQVLGEHLEFTERLRIEFDDFRDRRIPINPDSAKRLGYNNYVVMSLGGNQLKLALFSLAANRLEFLLPMQAPDLEQGAPVLFSLFFLAYRFSVPGTIEAAVRLPTGVQKASAKIEYSPELVHILEEYFRYRG